MEMKNTITISENDLKLAVAEYLKRRGADVTDDLELVFKNGVHVEKVLFDRVEASWTTKIRKD